MADRFVPKYLGRASLDDLAGRQASWTRCRYPAVFGPVVTTWSLTGVSWPHQPRPLVGRQSQAGAEWVKGGAKRNP